MEKNNNAPSGIFNTYNESEAIIKQLQQSVFDMKKLSKMDRDYQTEEHAVGYYNLVERMMDRGHGAFWGGLWGMLFGSALFVVGSALFVLPDNDPFLVFDPLFGWVVGLLAAAIVVGGLSTLAAELFSTGIPHKNSLRPEAVKATTILETGGVSNIDVHP